MACTDMRLRRRLLIYDTRFTTRTIIFFVEWGDAWTSLGWKMTRLPRAVTYDEIAVWCTLVEVVDELFVDRALEGALQSVEQYSAQFLYIMLLERILHVFCS